VASSQVRNLQVTLAVLATAGNLYNETTGLDGNEDGLLNDRPAGVGIFSLRGAGQFAVNGRATYTIPLRTAQSAGASQEPARYRIGVYVNVTNLTDHKNYGGYSGVQTSPFFEQPTLVINPRKVDMGLNISF